MSSPCQKTDQSEEVAESCDSTNSQFEVQASRGFFSCVETTWVRGVGLRPCPHLRLAFCERIALPYYDTGEFASACSTSKQTLATTVKKQSVNIKDQIVGGSGFTTAASKRQLFRESSQPEITIGPSEIVQVTHRETETLNESTSEPISPPPDVIPQTPVAGGQAAYNVVEDISQRHTNSLVSFENYFDDETPLFDPGKTNIVKMAEETAPGVRKYQSQYSEPAHISTARLKEMRSRKPSINRSTSHHPQLEKQNTPEYYEFMQTHEEKRAMFRTSSSSGYGTASKESSIDKYQTSVDVFPGGSMDGPENIPEEPNTSKPTFYLLDESEDDPVHGQDANWEKPDSPKHDGSTTRDKIYERVPDNASGDSQKVEFQGNSEIMDKVSPCDTDRGKNAHNLAVGLRNRINNIDASDNAQPINGDNNELRLALSERQDTYEIITLPEHLPAVLDGLCASLTTVSPASSHVVSGSEPDMIPAFVKLFSVSPVNSIYNSVSFELDLALYAIDDIPVISTSTPELGIHTLLSAEIDKLCDISAFLTDIDTVAVNNSEDHERFAMSIITSPTPSMQTMGFFYDKQICEGVAYTDKQLNDMLQKYRKQFCMDWMTEQLKNGKCVAEIVEELDRMQSDIEEDCIDSLPTDINSPQPNVAEERPWEMVCIEKASQCRDQRCTDQACKYGKNVLKILDTTCNYSHVDNPQSFFCRQILEHIYRHSIDCQQCNCTIPWCSFFHSLACEDESQGFVDCMQAFKREYFPSYLGYDYPIIDETSAQYTQFDDEGYESLPSQGVDYHIITRLCNHKDVFLASDIKNGYVILNRKPHRTESTDVLHELRRLTNSHIIPHLWAATTLDTQPCVTLTCTADQGRNLLDELQARTDGFDREHCIDIARQLKHVSAYLHEQGMMYLNWSGEHVLLQRLDESKYSVILCNFTHSSTVTMDRAEVAERLTMYLPPYLVPPEVYATDAVSFPESDYWGLGCLLYEVCVGKQLYHSIRHQPYEQQKSQISEIPSVASVSKGADLLATVTNLLRADPRQRTFQLQSDRALEVLSEIENTNNWN